MKLKNTIRVERAKLRITQKELAKYCQVSHQAIQKIENGSHPNLITAFRIAEYFDCSINDIFKIE